MNGLVWAILGAILAAILALSLNACAFLGGFGLCRAPDVEATGFEALRDVQDRNRFLRDRIADLKVRQAQTPACPQPKTPPKPQLPPEETLACEDDVEPVPVDLYLLQDLSGSFSSRLKEIVAAFEDLTRRVQNGEVYADLRVGIGSFVDKNAKPDPSYYTFKEHIRLTPDLAKVRDAAAAMKTVSGGGLSGGEAQLEALFEAAERYVDLGFRKDARRFIVLSTDDLFFQAGDARRKAPSSSVLSRLPAEDGIPDGNAYNEDYPSIAQVKASVAKAGVTVIFVVDTRKSGLVDAYEGLARQLGTARVVPLSGGPLGLMKSIFQGIAETCEEARPSPPTP